jgi:sugar lactone lactonase YvrE
LKARIARLAASLAAFALLGLCAVSPVSARVTFTKAWGWGVLDGASQFETCTTTCQSGSLGGGAGELDAPDGVAVDASGDVFVADTGNERIDEFSSSGAFIKAWGWGVADGAGHLEICTTACLGQGGLSGGGAGELSSPDGVAVDASGEVFVADYYNNRVDEFSSAGAFIKAWGWGVADGQSQLETCTTTCQFGLGGGGAGQLHGAYGIALDGSGEVFVTEYNNNRIVEFSSAGAFIKAWGWGVTDGAGHLETCTTTCRAGSQGGGAGELNLPDKVAVDGSGDVLVTDYYNDRVDEFSSAGAFVKAWGWGVADGQSQLETCTTVCQAGLEGGGAGQFYYPNGVAVDGSRDVFVSDYNNNRVDEFSSAGVLIDAWGTAGAGAGQLNKPYGVAVDGSGDVFVAEQLNNRVDEFGPGGGGPGGGGPGGAGPAAPVDSARPVISGTPRPGGRLSCSTGGWTNNPTSFAYQWYRNGTLMAGFTGPTYTLGTLDEGTTFACVVTARNRAGSASAQSNRVMVPVPLVPHCPAATGHMTGTTIGHIRLGMTRARARYLYRRHSDRGTRYEDFFCLTPIGVRVGYASRVLLKALPSAERARLTGRIVWASTSNPYYSLDGIRPGESITTAAAVLDTEPPFHVGLNYWYLARKPGYTAVLKVRDNVVQELGIATNALTATRAAQSVLMHSFY